MAASSTAISAFMILERTAFAVSCAVKRGLDIMAIIRTGSKPVCQSQIARKR